MVAYLFSGFVGHYKQEYCTTDLIVIAILHDTLEDTTLTYDMIVEIFGKYVADGVRDLSRITVNGVKHAAFETLDSLYLQGKIGLLYVKLFDRLHNAKTLSFMNLIKQVLIVGETHDHFTVYAECLGLYDLNKELIDICSLYLDDVKPSLPQLEALGPSCSQDDSQILSLVFQNEAHQIQNLKVLE